MVQLNSTDIATDEDKLYGIDAWARLFKAKTWELVTVSDRILVGYGVRIRPRSSKYNHTIKEVEIKMITKENPSLTSTAEAIYMSTADQNILEQCRIREDNIAHEKYQNELISSLSKEKKALTKEKRALTKENKSLSSENARLRKLLEENGIKA